MNKPTARDVSMDQIDFDDQSYIITFEPSLSQLLVSIKNIGVLNPPLLQQKSDNSYRIVTGLKRILCLRQLGFNHFSGILCFAENTAPDFDMFILNLNENIGTRSLNDIEKSIVLHRLLYLYHVSEQRIVTEFLPLLGLGSNRSVLDRFIKLNQLETEIKIAIANASLSPDVAIALLDRSTPGRMAIFNLFQRLKVGKNRQKELLRLSQELAEIKGQSIDRILNRSDIEEILCDTKITPPRKTERIIEILKKLRYPLFSKVVADFNQIKKELKLPPNISLKPPPFFEGENYTIEFNFKNQADFKKIISLLNSIQQQQTIHKLEKLI